MQKNRHLLPLAALLVAVTIGGLGNTLIAAGAIENPWLFLSLRFIFGSIATAYWLPKIFKLPKRMKIASMLEVASILTLALSLSSISVALATIISSINPILSMLINQITGKQKLPQLIIIPILLGLTSTILLISQKPFTVESITGLALIILSNLLGTAGVIINGWYGTETSPWVRVSLTNMLGAIIFTPMLIINLSTPQAVHPTFNLILVALFTAALAGSLAKGLYLYALQTISVPATMQANTLSTITAALTAWIFLGQTLNITETAGILLGIITIIALSIIVKKQAQQDYK